MSAPDASSRFKDFPIVGDYRATWTDLGGNHSESKMELELLSDEAFRALVFGKNTDRCRDEQLTIARGHIEWRIICDAPDGDIHNIPMSVTGNYTRDSVDFVRVTTVFGVSGREEVMFRLIEGSPSR